MSTYDVAKEIRLSCLRMTNISKGSHIASCLSIVDVLTVLYSSHVVADRDNFYGTNRDKVIMSKGHASAAIYATLGHFGFIPISELDTHYQNGGNLSGHVSHKNVNGVEFSTGSLGHGLPVGVGMALASRESDNKVYVVLGDGECNEGSVWEAALVAAHYNLKNLTVIVDYNKMQSLDYCDNTIKLSPLDLKWKSFGWEVISIDGHDHLQIENALSIEAKDRPIVIIANTIKGKGVSFMESNILWHYRSPQGKEYDDAVSELKESHA